MGFCSQQVLEFFWCKIVNKFFLLLESFSIYSGGSFNMCLFSISSLLESSYLIVIQNWVPVATTLRVIWTKGNFLVYSQPKDIVFFYRIKLIAFNV